MNKQAFTDYQRERLLLRAKTLIAQLEDNDLPNFLIAENFVLMLQSALAAFGTDLTVPLTRWLLSTLRWQSGYCQHCESDIPYERSHPPLCEQCDAKLQHEVDDLVRRVEEQQDDTDYIEED